MAWYDPSSWGQGEDPNKVRTGARSDIRNQATEAGRFGNAARGNYENATGMFAGTYGRLGESLDYLGGVMRGQNSVSAEQLRQGLQQNLAAQRSMAASASPQNAAMAARTAAIQAGRLGAGLAGQQALAGIQERNAAAAQYGQLGQALGQLQLGQRGQDVNAALGARGQALQAYLGILNGAQNQGWLEKNKALLQAAGGAAMSAGGGGGAGSMPVGSDPLNSYWRSQIG